ncbi:hypothetical protein AAMO2058_000740900 [Amorphochlora amoebiformis]|mmetsp:Transcript_35029/g.56542  ORF Transcript_35029/g.56542 Transcript_35029/m.56542 type:complete len:355 (-) Transcript_35029:41-1105(-)
MVRINPKTRRKRQLKMPEALQGQFLDDCQDLGIYTAKMKATDFTVPMLEKRNLVLDLLQLLAMQAYVAHQQPLPWHIQRQQEFDSQQRRKARLDKIKCKEYVRMDSKSKDIDSVDMELCQCADKYLSQDKGDPGCIYKLGEELYCLDSNRVFQAFQRYNATWILTTSYDFKPQHPSHNPPSLKTPAPSIRWCTPPCLFGCLTPLSKVDIGGREDEESEIPKEAKMKREETDGEKQIATESALRQLSTFQAFSVFIDLIKTDENRSARYMILFCTIMMAIIPLGAFKVSEIGLEMFTSLSTASVLTVSGIVALATTKVVALVFVVWAYRIDEEYDSKSTHVEASLEKREILKKNQ